MNNCEERHPNLQREERKMNVKDKLLPELDLDKIVKKTAKQNDWSQEQAQEAEMQYRGFLKATMIENGESFVPTFEIDEVWHNHILDTQKYSQDCKVLFGHILHHEPSYGDDAAENNFLKGLATKTQKFFKENFSINLDYSSKAVPSNDFADNMQVTCQGKCHTIPENLTCCSCMTCRSGPVKGLAIGA